MNTLNKLFNSFLFKDVKKEKPRLKMIMTSHLTEVCVRLDLPSNHENSNLVMIYDSRFKPMCNPCKLSESYIWAKVYYDKDIDGWI